MKLACGCHTNYIEEAKNIKGEVHLITKFKAGCYHSNGDYLIKNVERDEFGQALRRDK